MNIPLRSVIPPALVAALCLAACGPKAPANQPKPAINGSVPKPVDQTPNPADVEFMTGMIPHHAQAVLMAGWAASHGARADVRILCERIVVGQRDEIKLMQTWLADRGPQAERFVRHEIAAILETLDVLHRGQGLHRDLTPFNVFVCEAETLKLGDFGIATHQASRRGVTADAFNPLQAPTEIAWGKVRKWQQRDDIYQVGQLIAMLLRGDVHAPMRSKDVRGLPCSDHLKEVIHRCLGARAKRYQAADELVAALRHKPAELKTGRISSLKGRRISFTGFLSRPRKEAIAAAKRAGATFQATPGPSTDVLVRGRPNALQVAGKAGGLKLMEIRRLAAQGHKVTIINEAQFWKLAKKR